MVDLDMIAEIVVDALEYVLGIPSEEEEQRNAVAADLAAVLVMIRRAQGL